MTPSTTKTPDAQRSFRLDARDRAFGRLVRARLALAPVLGVAALTLAVFEPAPWRRVLLVSVVAMFCVVSTVEVVRYRRHGLGALQLPFNLLVMALGQLGIIFATGGLFSPVVPALFLVAVLASILVERPVYVAVIVAVELPAFWALAFMHAFDLVVPTLMPEVFGDAGELEHGVAPWIAASAYTLMLGGVSQVGVTVRSVFEGLFDEAMGERDRVLTMHAEQSRALTALSGEIAHELKNPLASVKGLGQLIARDIDGKPAERLAVLRREVDRMQGILEELLNFSRPLVPLAMERADLRLLVADVARLHEGSASGRDVRLSVRDGGAARVPCDPRKVRQILINLVQNALEASSPGAEVELSVEARADAVAVLVRDRGDGVDESVRSRVFEPGVTTKEHGSGFGLVVARSLARQHGGELTLSAREGGGSIAELVLPTSPRVEGP